MTKTPSRPPGAAGAAPFLGSGFLALGSAGSAGSSYRGNEQRLNAIPGVWNDPPH